MNSRWHDSKLSWTPGILIVLLALCFASATQADGRMYTSSLIMHAFGNDTTTGTAPPLTTARRVGIPLLGQCNTQPFHPQEELMLGGNTFTVPAYGGATLNCTQPIPGVPPVTCGTPLPCGMTTGGTMMLPDGGIPCGCGATTVEAGQPLTQGTNTAIQTTGMFTSVRTSLDPRAFTLMQSHLNFVGAGPRAAGGPTSGSVLTGGRSIGASFERYGVYHWEVHFADLHNDAGAFSKNGGDGTFGPIIPLGAMGGPQKRRVSQTAGKNKFGGTMSLLGHYGDNEGYFFVPLGRTSVFYYRWLFNYLGHGGQPTDNGEVTAGYVVGPVPAYGYTRTSGQATTSYAEIEVFKWTTGTVNVTAVGGTFPTIQTEKGYDNRTGMGMGAVQLVSPMMSKWTGAGSTSTGGLGILKINFAPEPSEWMMLAGGGSMLALLFYSRRARRS